MRSLKRCDKSIRNDLKVSSLKFKNKRNSPRKSLKSKKSPPKWPSAKGKRRMSCLIQLCTASRTRNNQLFQQTFLKRVSQVNQFTSLETPKILRKIWLNVKKMHKSKKPRLTDTKQRNPLTTLSDHWLMETSSICLRVKFCQKFQLHLETRLNTLKYGTASRTTNF